jgi:hypothetical protein
MQLVRELGEGRAWVGDDGQVRTAGQAGYPTQREARGEGRRFKVLCLPAQLHRGGEPVTATEPRTEPSEDTTAEAVAQEWARQFAEELAEGWPDASLSRGEGSSAPGVVPGVCKAYADAWQSLAVFKPLADRYAGRRPGENGLRTAPFREAGQVQPCLAVDGVFLLALVTNPPCHPLGMAFCRLAPAAA